MDYELTRDDEVGLKVVVETKYHLVKRLHNHWSFGEAVVATFHDAKPAVEAYSDYIRTVRDGDTVKINTLSFKEAEV